MDTIFMNSGNSKTPDPHKPLLNLSEVALWNLSIYYAWKNIEKSYKNNKPKISAPAWNEVFEFPFCIRYSGIFWVYINIHGEKINDNNSPSIKIYLNKMENRITFKLKTVKLKTARFAIQFILEIKYL